jgi:hypothetical protein
MTHRKAIITFYGQNAEFVNVMFIQEPPFLEGEPR